MTKPNSQGSVRPTTHAVRYFEVYPNGDPYSSTYDVSEYEGGYDGPCYYYSHMSGRYRKNSLVRELRRIYPDCKIRYRN